MAETIIAGLWNFLVFVSHFVAKTVVLAYATMLVRNLGWSVAALLVIATLIFLVWRSRRPSPSR